MLGLSEEFNKFLGKKKVVIPCLACLLDWTNGLNLNFNPKFMGLIIPIFRKWEEKCLSVYEIFIIYYNIFI